MTITKVHVMSATCYLSAIADVAIVAGGDFPGLFNIDVLHRFMGNRTDFSI